MIQFVPFLYFSTCISRLESLIYMMEYLPSKITLPVTRYIFAACYLSPFRRSVHKRESLSHGIKHHKLPLISPGLIQLHKLGVLGGLINGGFISGRGAYKRRNKNMFQNELIRNKLIRNKV